MTPRNPKQNEALRAESRAKIMEHALQLFAMHGYSSTTVRMIAESAGVAQGLLYRYFDGKEQLLIELFEQSMRDVRESFTIAEDTPDPKQRLERLIRASFAILRERLDFWRLGYRARTQAAVISGLGEQLQTWTAEIQSTLVRYLREAGFDNAEVEARVLFALIDGVSQHYALDPEHYPLDAVADAIVAKYRSEE